MARRTGSQDMQPAEQVELLDALIGGRTQGLKSVGAN